MLTYHLDAQSGVPLYEQLYRAVRADIMSGALAGGTRLLTGSADATVKLWDPRDAATPLFSADTREPVLALAVSAAEPLAVAGLADNTALVLSLATGKTVARLVGHEGVIEAVGFVSMFVFHTFTCMHACLLVCSFCCSCCC